MDENKDIREELEGIAPELSRLKRKDSFEAPANYFEELPSAVQDRIIANKPKRETVFLRRWVPAFAVLLILLTAGLFLFRNTGTQPVVQPVAQVPADTEVNKGQIAFNDTVLEVIDEDLLVEELADNSYIKPVANKIQPQPEELEEYILDNYDESLLIEEL